MHRPRRALLTVLLLSLAAPPARPADGLELTVDPARLRLRGLRARWSLLVAGRTADGRLVDRTSAARFESADPRVARITAAGVVHPVGDGTTSVLVEVDGRHRSVAVTVEGTAVPRRFHFVNDVEPLLSRFGCNASTCHGKAEGQNGFKLSVFGFDPAADYAALTQEARGRRVFPAAPEQSLLLRKMSGRTAHGGGVRIAAASAEYETLRGWIAAGAPFGAADEPGVVAVRIEPHDRTLEVRSQQRLRVVATYADGREADVTAHARFQSNSEAVAMVGPNGLVRAGDVPGQAAIMASFMNAVDTFRAIVPRHGRIDPYPALPENNFIDTLVFRELRRLNILPSEPAGDAEYLRRAYLDVIGTLPTAAEARQFLADPGPTKRARLVDELLQRPEFADLWALRWADLLRVDRAALGPKRAYAYYKWIRDGFAAGRPYDQLARELLTAEGLLDEVPPGAFYKAMARPGQTASTLVQVFLGVRIACAECHHHPFDRWTQDDYYGMQAFFSGVQVQGTPAGEAVAGQGPALAKNPRTGADVIAHPLAEKLPAKAPAGDPREALADWLTAKDNPWFARNLANRVWAHLMGRGLVEPVDDVRGTNPPTHPELLDALAQYTVEHHYDIRALIRLITASRVYQLSSRPNATNERDEQNYSRARFKRLGAEVLLDMVSQVTGVPECFPGAPPGTRAIQLWDSKVSHYFLKVFGRPERITACECERRQEPSVAQVLHLLNAPQMQARFSHEGGLVAKLVRREASDRALVEELYLTYYSRPPTDGERQAALEYLAQANGRRRQAAEDLAWSLMNSLEFLFNH
jgi:hypothetical protein